MKINLSKCKAVWIGKRRFDDKTICSNLKIIWSKKFRLLGVDFDADLSEMNTNFIAKIEEIKKVYKIWLYRSLTPIGRITLIKTMALPKLSHVVLVCPHMTDHILKELESASYKFLWKNKPDRIKRLHTTLPYGKGGLNMPDISKFWNSLKMAWVRKMQISTDVWWNILQLSLLEINYDISDIWYAGPNRPRDVSNKLTNKFWSETFQIAGSLMDTIPFAYPHFFFHLNLFDNDLFSVNRVPLTKNEFGDLWKKGLCQVADYFDTRYVPPKILTLTEVNKKFNVNLDFLRYHRVKTIIELGSERLNHKILNLNYSDICTPRQPILFKLSNLSKKGSRIFYRTLQAKDLLSDSTEAAEDKWRKEINLTFSIKFWDDCWKLIKNPFIDNKTKWIQLQINRFILPTNYSVNKYNPNQNPGCSFCPENSHLEQLQFLLWECPKVKLFWAHVETFFEALLSIL